MDRRDQLKMRERERPEKYFGFCQTTSRGPLSKEEQDGPLKMADSQVLRNLVESMADRLQEVIQRGGNTIPTTYLLVYLCPFDFLLKKLNKNIFFRFFNYVFLATGTEFVSIL